MERESFKSRLGFILVSAGCAIGIGNVWRFPYVAGENGGGLFVFALPRFPCSYGYSRIDNGACSGQSKPKKRRARLQKT